MRAGGYLLFNSALSEMGRGDILSWGTIRGTGVSPSCPGRVSDSDAYFGWSMRMDSRSRGKDDVWA